MALHRRYVFIIRAYSSLNRLVPYEESFVAIAVGHHAILKRHQKVPVYTAVKRNEFLNRTLHEKTL